MSLVVALLGAESTGKTTIAQRLVDILAAQGRQVALVGEYLREFCDQHQRTPRQDEQQQIADEQMRRIAHAAATHDIVIADTTALMIAVYSDTVFGDAGLYARAEAAHREHCDLTLLTALDLPWQADGLQRDGPHVRAPVDARVRASLARAGIGYGIVFGSGEARVSAALASVRRALAPPAEREPFLGGAGWHWHCERCGDAACELHARLPNAGIRGENDPP
ncbi:MAG: ATP-binding protein [Burkholderiales bacterium]